MKKYLKLLSFTFSVVAFVKPIIAQTVTLVQQDLAGINIQTGGVNLNGKLIFVGNDPIHGTELWISDGTSTGTKLLKDINVGSGSSNVYLSTVESDAFEVINNILFFTADDGITGIELWKTDGTESGTVLVQDIYPGISANGFTPNTSYPTHFTNVNGVLYFVARNSSNGKVSLYKISNPTVPVELITFTAKPTNNKVQLDWKTAAELNTLGYDVERSTDGQTWSKLGFVGAKNLPSEYQYFDQTPKLNEVNYYRLCTVDIDDKREFSKIVSVKMNEVRSPIRIYPSVTEGVINIETTLNIQQVWVSNANGQIVLTSTQSSLNLGSFPTGVYVVTVKGGDSIFSETVFKQ